MSLSNRISVPKIMESAAGFYVGTSFTEFECDREGNVVSQYEVPYSRLSDYRFTKEAVEPLLVQVLDRCRHHLPAGAMS